MSVFVLSPSQSCLKKRTPSCLGPLCSLWIGGLCVHWVGSIVRTGVSTWEAIPWMKTEAWASTFPPTPPLTPLPVQLCLIPMITSLNLTRCWRSPGQLCLSVTPALKTWSWASLSSSPLCTPVAHRPPPLPHGWTHLTCPLRPHRHTPPLSAHFLPVAPSLPLHFLRSPPPCTPSTLHILRRCVRPLLPDPPLIRTSAQHLTPSMMAGRCKEGRWRRIMLERGMEIFRSAPWSLPALHLCTILHLKKVSYRCVSFCAILVIGYD